MSTRSSRNALLRGAAVPALAAAAIAVAPGLAAADTIRFWTIEEQPERLAIQQEMAAAFKAETGHDVNVIPVTESDLGTRATAAFAAGDLPDVIYFTLQYVLPWAEAGILDVETNDEIVEDLGRDTFVPAALQTAQFDGLTAAVPADGWTQMIVYRNDLFEANGLAPPTTFEAVVAAIDALHNPPEIYGFVTATKVDENYMSQVLEHVFLANDVTPVDENGFKPLDEQKTIEVLEFYKKLADASPPGDLYWQQSRELYFSGKAAMIIWSPPTTSELAEKTGVVTRFAGPSHPDGAAWADIRYLGVTADANIDVAADFVRFAMDEGYEALLSIAPEGKFPVRRGDAEDPEKFVRIWEALPVGVDRKAPLSELYAAETIAEIVGGLESAARWGVAEGQLALASNIINSQEINRIVRQYLDGERDAAATVARLNETLARIQ